MSGLDSVIFFSEPDFLGPPGVVREDACTFGFEQFEKGEGNG
jgi:hypothetical protein